MLNSVELIGRSRSTRVMITRRCHDRRMFLAPCGDPRKGHTSEETANFFGYTLARAVKLYGVSFHGAILMGNHHHTNIPPATTRSKTSPMPTAMLSAPAW